MSGQLEGKVAVITGAASGIGRGTVEVFVDQGAKVVAADIQDDRGERLVEDLGADNVAYIHTDVASESDVKSCLDLAVSRFGRLDCLFNNAGFGGVMGPIEETDVEGYHDTINVLVLGVVLGMKHAVPIMRSQGGGSIISTASVAGISAGFGPPIYSAAKAAVVNLSRAVALEVGQDFIRVNAICPGGIATPIFGKAMGLATQVADTTLNTIEDILKDGQPIPRAGLPSDIGNMAAFLASDASSFVSGQVLVVDGGLTAGPRRSGGLGERLTEYMTDLGEQPG